MAENGCTRRLPDTGRGLYSQPTLSRLENAAPERRDPVKLLLGRRKMDDYERELAFGMRDIARPAMPFTATSSSRLRRRGLTIGPELAVADGALGFWKALEVVWLKTRGQRGWVHKTANVLNKLPKSQHVRAKRPLEEIWMAETKKDAFVAFAAFVEIYAIKYEKAVECLTKVRDALLAFYNFPAEHWKHLRTSNPVESTFATVRHRTVRSKGCLSNKTALAMVFKLAQAAEKHWRRIDGQSQLPKVILGVKFTDGIEVGKEQVQTAA
jgi:transposase-like protein